MLLPVFVSLVVGRHTVFLVSTEHRDIEFVLVYLHHFSQELPSPCYGFLLEIVAERPVTHHFEHGVMIGVTAHFFQIVVLTGHTQTLLDISHTRSLARVVTQENILKLIHTRIGKHQGRVILYNYWC